MNYYERHLGDYARDAGYLSMLEHGAYTLLMDRYYVTETGIPDEDKYRIARASSKEEKKSVDSVLKDFFTLENGIWIKGRIEEEITKAQTKIKAAQENGKRGGRPKANQEQSENKPTGLSLGYENKPTGLSLGYENETQLKAHHTPDTRHHINQEQTHTVETNTSVEPTLAASVCLSMKLHGIQDINPSHPTLLALLNSGAIADEFIQAAIQAKSGGKGFSYSLGIVRKQREEAAKLVLHQGAMPTKSSYADGITIAANSVFKDEYIAEQTQQTKQLSEGEHAQLN